MSAAPAFTPPKKPFVLLLVGSLLAAASVVGGTWMLLATVMPVTEVSTAPNFTVPGTHETNLEPGRYGLYLRNDNGGADQVRSSDVTVTDPSGARVPVASPEIETPLNLGQEGTWRTQVEFDANAAGRYRIDVEGDRRLDARVAPALTAEAYQRIALTVLVAGVVFVVGAGLMIAGFVQRSRFNRRMRAGPFPPYGAPPGYPPYGAPPGYPPYGPPPGYPPPGAPPGAVPPGPYPPGPGAPGGAGWQRPPDAGAPPPRPEPVDPWNPRDEPGR
jgi:hypothetical protein